MLPPVRFAGLSESLGLFRRETRVSPTLCLDLLAHRRRGAAGFWRLAQAVRRKPLKQVDSLSYVTDKGGLRLS
jgi:hypothetical protein